MIIPATCLPTLAESIDAKNVELCDFISHIGIISPVLLQIKVSIENYDETLLVNITSKTPCHFTGLSIQDDQMITKLLDNGLRLAILSVPADFSSGMNVISTFPRNRVGLECSYNEAAATIAKYREYIGHFVINAELLDSKSEDYENLLAIMKNVTKAVDTTVQLIVIPPNNITLEGMIHLATYSDYIHAVQHARIFSTILDSPVKENPYLFPIPDYKYDLLDTFIGCLRTDREDKMYSTVVCDIHGVCLGLVYSNRESIRVAFAEKRGVYWSRSRASLWRKGDTSGMHQDLIRLGYDCDRDALRFTIVQRGEPPSFCHLMTKTCWGEEIGVAKLEQMLKDRKQAAPEGSYTKRLFDDSDLLRKKLLEEVQELVEATDPDHVAAEAADVLYFMMTRCVAAGVGMKEIEEHLEKRSYKVTRRPGNAKDWRTVDAEAVLEQINK